MKLFTTSFFKYSLSLLILFSVSLLSAQSPTISIQGTLKSANGSSVPDGPQDVVFKLYHTPTGPTVLWEEDTIVDVIGSIYSHYLGSKTPLNVAHFSATVYLGVTVGNYELVPRTELSYAPYAFAVYGVICSGALGDIKYSILNPTQFAMVNGDCWAPMNGGSIAGSALETQFGINSKPDGGGLFLRAQEFSGSPNNDPERDSNTLPGTFQGDDFKEHKHTIMDPGHTHNFEEHVNLFAEAVSATQPLQKTVADFNIVDITNPTTKDVTNISINNNGGSETRPKNLNFYIYIRIN